MFAFRNRVEQHEAIRPFNKKLPVLTNANRPCPTKVEGGINWRTLNAIVFEVWCENHGFNSCEIVRFVFWRIADMQGNIDGDGVEVETFFTDIVFHELQAVAQIGEVNLWSEIPLFFHSYFKGNSRCGAKSR